MVNLKKTNGLVFSFTLLLFFSCNSYKIKSYNSNNIIIDESLPNDELSEINFKNYKDSLKIQNINEIINYSNKTLNVGCPEGLLGNFICDLSLFSINQNEYQQLKPDFCVLNNGGLRSSINKGEVTKADIFEVMPFDNSLVTLELSHDKMELLLKYIVEKSISNTSRKSGVPVSGIRLKIDRFNNIKRCMINNMEYNKNITYHVLTTDYLANGGDNMSFFKSCKRYKNDVLLRDIIINYIKTLSLSEIKIDAELDGRITISQ